MFYAYEYPYTLNNSNFSLFVSILQEGRAGYTALHLAVFRNDAALVKFLLTECTKINKEALSYGQLTAYQLAKRMHHNDLACLMENSGCNRLSPPVSDMSSDESDEFDDD